MSLWQHKNLHKRHLLWLKLLSICLLFHLIVLLWVFFIHNNNVSTVSLSLHKHLDYSAPILFIPIGTITTTQSSLPKKIISTTIPSSFIEQQSPVQQNVTNQENKTTIQIPEVITHNTIQPATVPIKKEIAKRTTPTPIAPIKKEVPAKTPPITQPIPSNAIKRPIIPTIPDNAHVSHNYKEVEALRRNTLLQKELINTWKPPIGVPFDASRELSFFVDKNGSIKKIEITKSSGIMMYDISARNAIFSMKMPQWTHDKTLTIMFKQ